MRPASHAASAVAAPAALDEDTHMFRHRTFPAAVCRLSRSYHRVNLGAVSTRSGASQEPAITTLPPCHAVPSSVMIMHST